MTTPNHEVRAARDVANLEFLRVLRPTPPAPPTTSLPTMTRFLATSPLRLLALAGSFRAGPEITGPAIRQFRTLFLARERGVAHDNRAIGVWQKPTSMLFVRVAEITDSWEGQRNRGRESVRNQTVRSTTAAAGFA